MRKLQQDTRYAFMVQRIIRGPHDYYHYSVSTIWIFVIILPSFLIKPTVRTKRLKCTKPANESFFYRREIRQRIIMKNVNATTNARSKYL